MSELSQIVFKHVKRSFVIGMLTSVLVACSGSGDDGIGLADGSVYFGQTKDGVLHGDGELILLSGSRYKGQFKDGVFHGNGSLFYYNGDVYHGEFNKGVQTGKGVYTTINGVTYEGDFFQGAANGSVKINNSKSGYTYSGQVHQWELSGFGEFIQGELTYSGYFLNNVYHGKGTLEDEIRTYSGEFSEGLYNGLGVYTIDGATYSGEFDKGSFSGLGVLKTEAGDVYAGEFKDWKLHGNGKVISQNGDSYIGDFVDGVLNGKGKFISADGKQYSGDFSYGKFDGFGVLSFPGGEIYKGEFSYGRYHGQGRLETPDTASDTISGTGIGLKVEQGRWEYGRLIENDLTGINIKAQPEVALEYHQQLLTDAISQLKPSDSDERNLYFIGLGGDGTQSVFRREVEYVDQQLAKRFDTEGRSIQLINDHETAEKYPLATTRSFKQAVNAMAKKMDKGKDVLFLYLTSHGSENHYLSLGHDGIKLPDISASTIKDVLRESEIKWKVIIVSACYSGGFIPELDDGNSLILTASDAKNTSFGCSDDSKMTYFGKALFQEVLSKDSKINFKDAFVKAREIIAKWEKEEELPPSNPLIKEQEDVIMFLQAMSK